MNPKVSVIIPMYNAEEFIAEAIESVLGQTYQNFEIICIDDGSIDKTRERVGPYVSAGKVLYDHQANQGIAAARNRGIELASGEFLSFLDADDAYLPDSLEKRVALAVENDIKFIFSDFYWIKEKKDFYAFGRCPPALGKTQIDRLGGASRVNENSWTAHRDDFIRQNIVFLKVWTGTVLVESAFWKNAVNRFFDSTLNGVEDMDMWWHLLLHKDLDRIGYVDCPLARYRFYNNSWTKKDLDEKRYAFFERVFSRLTDFLTRKELAQNIYHVIWAWYPESARYKQKLFGRAWRLDPLNFRYIKGYLGCALKSQ